MTNYLLTKSLTDGSNNFMFIREMDGKSHMFNVDALVVNLFNAFCNESEENKDRFADVIMSANINDVYDDAFVGTATEEQLAMIDRVNVFKPRKSEDEEFDTPMIYASINGVGLVPKELTNFQWMCLWLSSDMKAFKKKLAFDLYPECFVQKKTRKPRTKKTEELKPFFDEEQKEEQPTEQNDEQNAETEDVNESEDATKDAEPKEENKELSPMLKQFYDLKKKHPDAILLFRCGDFYETYTKDAEDASKILGITLTRSTKQKDKEGKNLAMAGFPYHALDTYLPKLIRAGKRVAICDQIEDPKKTEKLAKRGITEMVKP